MFKSITEETESTGVISLSQLRLRESRTTMKTSECESTYNFAARSVNINKIIAIDFFFLLLLLLLLLLGAS